MDRSGARRRTRRTRRRRRRTRRGREKDEDEEDEEEATDIKSNNPQLAGGGKNAFRARLPSKLHRQLIHQHHLQSHLHCGNDPTVANHNGILSTAHARKTLETPLQCGTDPRMIRP